MAYGVPGPGIRPEPQLQQRWSLNPLCPAGTEPAAQPSREAAEPGNLRFNVLLCGFPMGSPKERQQSNSFPLTSHKLGVERASAGVGGSPGGVWVSGSLLEGPGSGRISRLVTLKTALLQSTVTGSDARADCRRRPH